MKLKSILISIFLFLAGINLFPQQNNLHSSAGPYLGQKLPGVKAEIFAPEIVSTGLDDNAITFTPDGKECFWHVVFTGLETILTSRLENGQWTKPEVASFSGMYSDGWPAPHPNGKILFFHSQRETGNKDFTDNLNIWYVEKTSIGWSEPKLLGAPVNGKGNAGCPSVTNDGTLYISKRFPDGTEQICRSKFVNGKYLDPEILPKHINISKYNFHAYIAPDESYLIYPTGSKPDIIGGGWNYYVSFRTKDDKWSELINIGKSVNSERSGAVPSISSDGKYFFFQASTNITWIKSLSKKHTLSELLERENRIPGRFTNDIYWIETSVIEQLRPPGFK